jgi:hypothetical protein
MGDPMADPNDCYICTLLGRTAHSGHEHDVADLLVAEKAERELRPYRSTALWALVGASRKAAKAAVEDRDQRLTDALATIEILKGVIARAITASDSIADRDAEDAIQEMLRHLLEPEPEGHDDRIEWARMEGANAMLEIIVAAGYGARGISDNRDGLRKEVAKLAVAATMPRKPEPEFEAALLQREVEQLRAQLAEQQVAAHARADAQADEWRAEMATTEQWLADFDKMRALRDAALRLVEKQRYRIEVDENDLDEAGFFDDDGVRLSDPHPKILKWMAAHGFEFVDVDQPDGRSRGIWRGNILVRPGAPRADESVVNDLASSVGRAPLDVLAEIAAMVIETAKPEPGWYWCHRGTPDGRGPFQTRPKAIADALACGADGIDVFEIDA